MARRDKKPAPGGTPEEGKLSDGVIAGPFRAAALCRTSNGWAVAIVEVDIEGRTVGLVQLGPSQSFPEIVAQQLVRRQMAINQETLTRYPWRP